MCSVERRGGGVFEESGRGARLPVVRRANAQKTLVRRRGYDRCHGRNGSRHVRRYRRFLKGSQPRTLANFVVELLLAPIQMYGKLTFENLIPTFSVCATYSREISHLMN